MHLPRIIGCVVLLALSAGAQRERFQSADVMYDWVANQSGQKLRTFITRPKTVTGKVPVIFFVGWLSCDTMEYPDANTRDGFGIFMRRLIEESGYATLRMDKPGVGESQGDCAKADFNSEMEGWRAAFDSLAKYDFMDRDRVFIVGLSNGGGFSPLAAQQHPVLGFVSAGSWGRTWYGHMLELERANDGRGEISGRGEHSGKSLCRFLQPVPDERHDTGAGYRSASRMEAVLVRHA